jgi:hypothetical protein
LGLREHIRKQEECERDLLRRLRDLGEEFAELMQVLDLQFVPVMDTTGTAHDHQLSNELGYRSNMKPTGVKAFPLDVSLRTSLQPGGPHLSEIFVTVDGEFLFTEKLVHKLSLGSWRGSGDVEAGKLQDYFLIFAGAMGHHGSWQPHRERTQRRLEAMLSEVAYRTSIQGVIAPIEFAILDVYNSRRRRGLAAARNQAK